MVAARRRVVSPNARNTRAYIWLERVRVGAQVATTLRVYQTYDAEQEQR